MAEVRLDTDLDAGGSSRIRNLPPASDPADAARYSQVLEAGQRFVLISEENYQLLDEEAKLAELYIRVNGPASGVGYAWQQVTLSEWADIAPGDNGVLYIKVRDDDPAE